MGVVACVLGVPSITHWFERSGYTGWGVAGIALGGTAVSLGLAYQIKHMQGALDGMYHPLPTPGAYYVIGLSVAFIIAGLITARRSSRPAGVLIAGLAIAVAVVASGFALTTADRELTASRAEQAAKQQ